MKGRYSGRGERGNAAPGVTSAAMVGDGTINVEGIDFDIPGPQSVAIMQWRNEIEMHTDNMLKTLVWHGSSRETSVKELKKYDVVSVCLVW